MNVLLWLPDVGWLLESRDRDPPVFLVVSKICGNRDGDRGRCATVSSDVPFCCKRLLRRVASRLTRHEPRRFFQDPRPVRRIDDVPEVPVVWMRFHIPHSIHKQRHMLRLGPKSQQHPASRFPTELTLRYALVLAINDRSTVIVSRFKRSHLPTN